MSRLLGAVLAGGQSRRFGSDKALALLDERPLIAHAVTALARHVEQVAVCGRSFETHLALADRPAPSLGPLGGLAAALYYAAEHGFDAVLSLGCDTPLVPSAVFEMLLAQGPTVALRALPICGLWCVKDADRLTSHLAIHDDRSVRGWLASCRGEWLDTVVSIANVNTPNDLALLTAQRH